MKHQLINVIHHNLAQYSSNWFGKDQCVLVIEKVHDPATGVTVKRCIRQEKPTITYFITNPEHQPKHTQAELAYPIAYCDEYSSPIEEVNLHCAQLTGQVSFYNEVSGPGANKRRRKIHDNRWLHGSDVNVVDAYMDRYMEHYKDTLDTTTPLVMAYADIEVDIYDHVGFPDEDDAPCPVNLITYFHAPTKKLTQFILRTGVQPNPQIAAFEAEADVHQVRILAECNRKPLIDAELATTETPWEELAELIGFIEGPDGPHPTAQAVARCHELEFHFYDTELELIRGFIHVVNVTDKPDTLAWWNMRFDIVTLINRLRTLGCDPAAEFTPKEFQPWVMANYDKDSFNTEPTECNDSFNVAAYTIYVDQMLLFAQLRKQTGKRESYTLDATLRSELGEHKYEYEGSIRDLAYRNFGDFVLYGAIDVVPMASLEGKTEDIALAYQLSMITRTRFHKIMKKTICLRNLAAIFYREKGLVLSNNRNKNKERTDRVQFKGA